MEFMHPTPAHFGSPLKENMQSSLAPLVTPMSMTSAFTPKTAKLPSAVHTSPMDSYRRPSIGSIEYVMKNNSARRPPLPPFHLNTPHQARAVKVESVTPAPMGALFSDIHTPGSELTTPSPSVVDSEAPLFTYDEIADSPNAGLPYSFAISGSDGNGDEWRNDARSCMYGEIDLDSNKENIAPLQLNPSARPRAQEYSSLRRSRRPVENRAPLLDITGHVLRSHEYGCACTECAPVPLAWEAAPSPRHQSANSYFRLLR